jgi:hypothetical protein
LRLEETLFARDFADKTDADFKAVVEAVGTAVQKRWGQFTEELIAEPLGAKRARIRPRGRQPGYSTYPERKITFSVPG